MMVITRTAAGVINDQQYSVRTGSLHRTIGKPLTVDEYLQRLEVGIAVFSLSLHVYVKIAYASLRTSSFEYSLMSHSLVVY